MRETGIRVGKVSSIDYESGMMRVTYKDKDNSVTTNCPYANFNNEYSMPKINDSVLVAHLSNGSSRGVVLGTMWNKKNIPAENGEALYRKELSKKPGAAMIRYEDGTGEYLVKAPNIMIHGVNQTDLEGPEVHIAANIKTSFESPEHSAYLHKVVFSGLEEADIETEVKNNIKVTMELADLEALIKKVQLETLEELKITVGTKLDIETKENISISGKEIKMEAERKFEINAQVLKIEDDKFSSNFTKIMERLEALDHDTSARK